MSYYIKCSIPEREFEIQLDDERNENHLTENEIFELVNDATGCFFDLASEARDAYQVKPIDVFNEEETIKSFCQQAFNYILSKKDEWFVSWIEADHFNQIIHSKRIDTTSFIKKLIEEEAEVGDFCAYVGKYVQDCILSYCEQSHWHIEKDRLWFAPDGMIPKKPWIIDSKTTEYEFDFWFGQDTWELMEYIGDFGEVFLIWYCAECGFCAPDMDDIINCCPVSFESDDTVQSLLMKCEAYVNNRMME